MTKIIILYIFTFYCSVSAANSCKILFKATPSNTKSMVKQSLVNTTIQGVMSVPQSSAGSIMFYLSKLLSEPIKIVDVLVEENFKRDFNTFDHKEFNKLVKVANHQHARPKLKSYTERAPQINTELFNLHRDMFRLKGPELKEQLESFENSKKIEERMYWRLVEIYRFPVTSSLSVLSGLLRSLSPELGREVGALKPNEQLQAIEEVFTSEKLRDDVDFVAQVLNEYIASNTFREKRVPEFQKIPAKFRTLKRDSPDSQIPLLDLKKDGLIASSIAFDLYPILRERFEPEKAFYTSMAVIGYEYKRSHEIFSATLEHRRDNYGLNDPLLNEVLKIQHIIDQRIVGERFFKNL